MKVVQGDTLSEDARSSHRGGTVSYVRLLDGEPNTLDGYSLIVARTPGRFSPRHRHNFEQFRLQLEGVADYGRTGKLKPGMIGYFPEGVHYGPQTQGEDLAMLVLQCGGASGGGYLGREGEMTYAQELKAFGEFKDGVFRRKDGAPGKKNLDGYQAIWEHKNGRPMEYPKPRYNRPVFMDPENLNWTPVEGADGVSEKFLGVFTECRTRAAVVRIETGATFTTGGRRSIFLVRDGAGEVEGQPYRTFTTVFTEKGETAAFRAGTATTLLSVDLPDLSLLRSGEAEPAAAAAE